MSEDDPKQGTKKEDGRRHNVPNGGKGRPKGTKNKATKAVKEMILQALDTAGGVDYLVRQAEENPGPFLALIGKVLPTTLQGPDDKELSITVKYE